MMAANYKHWKPFQSCSKRESRFYYSFLFFFFFAEINELLWQGILERFSLQNELVPDQGGARAPNAPLPPKSATVWLEIFKCIHPFVLYCILFIFVTYNTFTGK